MSQGDGARTTVRVDAQDAAAVRKTILPHNRPPLDLSRVRRALAECPEIDCIRHRLTPAAIAAAELRAAELGIGAERVLLSSGSLNEEVYAAALAAWLGVSFATLDDWPRSHRELSDDRLIAADVTGLLPLRQDDGSIAYVAAVRRIDVRRLIALLAHSPQIATRLRLTTSRRLRRYIMRGCGRAIEYRAADSLQYENPQCSAGHGSSWTVATMVSVVVILGALAAPGDARAPFEALLAMIFLAWTALRLFGAMTTSSLRYRRANAGERDLPVYTIIVALYREAAAVPGLVSALRRLRYPKEKLDNQDRPRAGRHGYARRDRGNPPWAAV